MLKFLMKCLRGETDINANGVPDNKELIILLEQYLKQLKEKEKEKV
jgi:hypothetical protein